NADRKAPHPSMRLTAVKDHDNSSDERTPSGPAGETSDSLLEGLQRKDQNAWDVAQRIYEEQIHRYCLQFGARRQDLNDLTQEVLTTVYRRIDDFRRQRLGSFRAFLKAIALRKVWDHYKREGRQPHGEGGTSHQDRLNDLPASLEAISPEEDGEGRREVHKRALEEIRPQFSQRFGAKTWEAFVQTSIYRRAPEDVAADLGMTTNAVQIARSRGRK